MREAREETGLAVRPLEILTVVDAIRRDGSGTVTHHYTLVEVLAEAPAGDPVAGDDAESVCWADLAAVDRLVDWAETRRIIRLAADRLAARRGG
jgi:8-oxo-dGTP diphosphatase